MAAVIQSPLRVGDINTARTSRGCNCNSAVTRVAMGSLHAFAAVIGLVGIGLYMADPTSKIGFLMANVSSAIGFVGVIVFIASERFNR